jgi:hypothetical protein
MGTADAVTWRMARLAWTALLLSALSYVAGCTRRSIEYGGDGGMPGECSAHTLSTCLDDDRCTIQSGCCNEVGKCVPKGTPQPQCFAPCNEDCQQLGEQSCLAAKDRCVADYCLVCSCTPTFLGCRGITDGQQPCPDNDCAQPECECRNLSESECKASTSPLGCSGLYCPDCKGGQYFAGCLGPNELGACPAVCPVDGCRTDKECSMGQSCLAPGATQCGGAPRICEACGGDQGCGFGQICAFEPCCASGGMTCIEGCSQTGCPEGETCGSSNHCIPTYCTTSVKCPPHFECNSANSCQRRLCNDDGDCPGGYCVLNQCYSSLGSCNFPAP